MQADNSERKKLKNKKGKDYDNLICPCGAEGENFEHTKKKIWE